jgi:cardiolipin synthase A/B
MPAARDLTLRRGTLLLIAASACVSVALWNSLKPMPAGTHVASLPVRLAEPQLTVLRAPDEILARELADIDRAAQMIVLDERPVAREIGQRLLLAKRRRPNLRILVVADNLDEASGGTPREYLQALEQAGVIVARARLDRLRDPAPLYSALWRLGVAWWSDPFDEAPGGLRAMLRRLNFKRDDRQLLVADDGAGGWISLLPAGAASDLAVEIAGGSAHDIAASELQIASWSTADDRLPQAPPAEGPGFGSIDARFLSEGAIRGALLDALSAAAAGDEISLRAQRLSERRVIGAALRAAERGVRVAMLLDPDAAPNRAVAAELVRQSSGRIEVRWQSGARGTLSLVQVRRRRELWAAVSAAGLARPDLGDLNLESAAELRLPERAAAARALCDYFAAAWAAAAPYARYAEDSPAAYWRYRLLDAAALAVF